MYGTPYLGSTITSYIVYIWWCQDSVRNRFSVCSSQDCFLFVQVLNSECFAQVSGRPTPRKTYDLKKTRKLKKKNIVSLECHGNCFVLFKG